MFTNCYKSLQFVNETMHDFLRVGENVSHVLYRLLHRVELLNRVGLVGK